MVWMASNRATASLRLVGLQRPDQVQLDAGVALAQRRPLGLRLLHAVLAEPAVAGIEHRRDVLGAEGLGDGDQMNRGRIALGRRAQRRRCAPTTLARRAVSGLRSSVMAADQAHEHDVVVAPAHEGLLALDAFLHEAEGAVEALAPAG